MLLVEILELYIRKDKHSLYSSFSGSSAPDSVIVNYVYQNTNQAINSAHNPRILADIGDILGVTTGVQI
ncbi:hypothetical protein EFE32_10645 [Lactococcus lactis subsp. lactis]|nr:hypothetical protein [Lactococcus lactis subsp. lactis]